MPKTNRVQRAVARWFSARIAFIVARNLVHPDVYAQRRHRPRGRPQGGAGQPALAGVAALVGAQARAVPARAGHHRRAHRDPLAEGAPGLMDVPAADGVPLHVEVDGQGARSPSCSPTAGPSTPPPGRRSPAALDAVRVVRYDHRGHGRSAAVDPTTMTMDQLADDLAAVIAAVAPDGSARPRRPLDGRHDDHGAGAAAPRGGGAGAGDRAGGDGRGRARGPHARPAAAARRRRRARGEAAVRLAALGRPADAWAARACSRPACAGCCSARTPTPRRGGSRSRRWRGAVRSRCRASGPPSTPTSATPRSPRSRDIPTAVLAGTHDRLTPVPMARRIVDGAAVGAAHGVPRRRAHAAGGTNGGRGGPPAALVRGNGPGTVTAHGQWTRGKPARPRHARLASSATASSRETFCSESSQYCAATCDSPTSPTASSRARAESSPASVVTASATVSMHRFSAPSTTLRGVAAQVGAEDQPVGLALARDEVEVRRDGRLHPLLVVGGGRQRRVDLPDQLVGVGGEQRLVELQLAGEVLVENGLADARALGDVVHRGGVVALRGEDVARRHQQLRAPGAAREPAALHRASRSCSPSSVVGGAHLTRR